MSWRRAVLMLGLLPLRIVNRAIHIGVAACRAGVAADVVWTLPVVLLGLTAWYVGMGQTYWEHAFADVAH